ncbi:MAG TPA: LysR substrate-binding domain-containing protein [Gammaproteobacteria bacterium]|jgi:LysR family hydrogen peroxide-inducible transcriptional activator|nr:LysR substrate-binding domain-containing protein [Gammaproteobacteria bacterium]
MNLRDLKYFVTLAETKHFSKAAKACFVSQPSLSIQIKKLETFLGVDLLERTSRSVLLTDIGKIIAEQARELLQQAETIQELAKSAQDPFSGELNLGVIPTLTSYLLPHLLPDLAKTESFPKLSIYLTEQQTSQLILGLKQGKLDAVILSLPVTHSEFTVQPLFEEELRLAVPERNSLAKKKIINATDLNGKHFILLEEGHCLRDQTILLCQKMHAEEAKNFRAASLEILRYMVSTNLGLTLMPTLACRPQQGLRYLPFAFPKPKRTIGIIWRSGSTKKLLLMRMVEHIRRLMSEQPGINIIH